MACLVDRNGIQGTCVGDLPEHLAAVNRTNINVQIMTVEAAVTGKREHIYPGHQCSTRTLPPN